MCLGNFGIPGGETWGKKSERTNFSMGRKGEVNKQVERTATFNNAIVKKGGSSNLKKFASGFQ